MTENQVVSVDEVNVIFEGCDSYAGFQKVFWNVTVFENRRRMLAFYADGDYEAVELADDDMIMTALLNKDFREEQFRLAFGAIDGDELND